MRVGDRWKDPDAQEPGAAPKPINVTVRAAAARASGSREDAWYTMLESTGPAANPSATPMHEPTGSSKAVRLSTKRSTYQGRAPTATRIPISRTRYVDYLNKMLPMVRPGGLILAHNTNMAPDYVKTVTNNPDLETVFYVSIFCSPDHRRYL